jgi:hypothetical protein
MRIGQQIILRGMPKIYAGCVDSNHLFCALITVPERLTWEDAISKNLPNRSELIQLDRYKKEIGGFEEGYYWSRDEESVNNAFALYFGDNQKHYPFSPNHESSGSKERTCLVRYVKRLSQAEFEALDV